MGVGKKAGVVYLIDFGLSKQFRDPNTHVHIPYIKTCGLIGSAVFTSIHSHLGWELGRRDDLESLAYILIYFLRGSLPWQNLGHQGNKILKLKQNTDVHDLCHGLPVEFCKFLQYTRSLSFDDKPDYNYLNDLLDGRLSALSKEEFPGDSLFDWSGGPGGQSVGDRGSVCDAYSTSGIHCTPVLGNSTNYIYVGY